MHSYTQMEGAGGETESIKSMHNNSNVGAGGQQHNFDLAHEGKDEKWVCVVCVCVCVSVCLSVCLYLCWLCLWNRRASARRGEKRES